MQINTALLSQIEEFLAKNPLEVGKIVRVKGLGEKYLAHADVQVEDNFHVFMECTISGVDYVLYIVTPKVLEDFSD